MFNKKDLVVGVGSALVDILVYEDDKFLNRINAVKGGMIYVEKDFIEHALTLTQSKPVIVPGGSACNTVVGVCKLGGNTRFVGKRGPDDMGNFFEKDLKKNKVEPVLFQSSSPTGRVLSVITPDAQRSMLTFLGAASENRPDEITQKCFNNAAIVHLEGYLLFNEALMIATLKSARKAGAKISLDLASFTVVNQSKALLEKIVHDFVDILIANEDEAKAFTEVSDEIQALKILSQNVGIAVLKVGERGSYIACDKKIIRVEPMGRGNITDTTGAGDLWASGFLFGLIKGFGFEKCGRLASACGYEVCCVTGANIPENGWNRIKKILEE